MDAIRDIVVPQGSTYGPLQSEFRYELREGYTALVGPNNAGKSAILQLIFRFLVGDAGFGPDRICMIRPDRHIMQTTLQPGNETLQQWNTDALGQFNNQPLNYGHNTSQGPPMATLPRLILHRSFMTQMRTMEELLPRLGYPVPLIVGAQEVSFESLSVAVQGSGLRTVLPILAALTDPGMKAILIDEPELSLEPRLQKAVREMLLEAAETLPAAVVVATHSHLFLNRRVPESTQIVTRREGETTVETIASARSLHDVTFDLLGSSTEDLFFPRNYLVVEGASDQEIVRKVLELLDSQSASIKVLAAQGIDTVRDTVSSVLRALVPLFVNDSPYATRVVALVDQPNEKDNTKVEKLKTDLGDRLHILSTRSIEAYVPESVYQRAERSREEDLRRIDELDRDYKKLSALKREISVDLARALTLEDLESIPEIAAAARQAIELSHSST